VEVVELRDLHQPVIDGEDVGYDGGPVLLGALYEEVRVPRVGHADDGGTVGEGEPSQGQLSYVE
jgi:hypothetical protein